MIFKKLNGMSSMLCLKFMMFMTQALDHLLFKTELNHEIYYFDNLLKHIASFQKNIQKKYFCVILANIP